jgi:Na+-driven multidrug efflux pump
MEKDKSLDVFEKAPVRTAVLKNALPAMAAMLMVLIYNLADTFFIGQTHNDILVASVSLATPVFLLFMAVGTIFGIGGTSVISRAMGEGRREYAKKVSSFCMWSCVAVGIAMAVLLLVFMDRLLPLIGADSDTFEYAKIYLTIVCYCSLVHVHGDNSSGRQISFPSFKNNCPETASKRHIDIGGDLDEIRFPRNAEC